MQTNFNEMRECLHNFDFHRLFIEHLGWSQPTNKQLVALSLHDQSFSRRQIAQLAGVVVFEIVPEQTKGRIPDAKIRAAIHKDISKNHHENLLIFIDADRTQSLWYWVKRQNGKQFPRDHFYTKGQPGDLFLSKLSGIVFDIGAFDESGNVSVVDVARRLKNALDVERVTKRFYTEFQEQHIDFLELITGIEDERQRRWYTSVLLNRLMFIYFLQRKFFLDNGDGEYLQNKLKESQKKGKDRYYKDFLSLLFFEGFAKPEDKRSPEAKKVLGIIRYLNGGLFLPHQIEQENPDINIPDKAFETLFALFQRYSWNLNDTPGGSDDEINPDVLGYIFEKYINQKEFGAYYTRTEITEYLCEHTIHNLILDAVNTPENQKIFSIPGLQTRNYKNLSELLIDLDADLCRKLLFEVLPKLSLLDPACGSGAFLVAAMKTLINVYSAVIGKVKFLHDRNLSEWLKNVEKEHKSLAYFIKKQIITDNLYGVDIMEEATEIARLRLFLALVAAAESVDQLEPLPNIDFNILSGNSLIGLMRVDDQEFEERTSQGSLFHKGYPELLKEKNRLINNFRHAATYAEDLSCLRDSIQKVKQEAIDTLNDILHEEFHHLGIKYEQATWDTAKNKPGKAVKRAVSIQDVERLRPFHWGYEFDEILNKRGGFDAIITNPPWEIFKPIAKEFCYEFDPEIERRGTDIKDFEARLALLLKDEITRSRYLAYLNQFPYVSAYYRSSSQYRNQISVIDGKKAGSDINLYKLFTEQCFNLLRPNGYCGIVIPSGIYSDLGTKQLREMLFSQTKIEGLFCFENRKEIFEGVHRSYKFVVLTYMKGGKTRTFPAAFMRHDVEELRSFPQDGMLEINVDLVRRLAPDSLSVMEFNNPSDVQIAEKMLQFPLLGEHIEDTWNLRLTNEFHMTNDSHLFDTKPGIGRLPLYEGKMIWQLEKTTAVIRYWVSEKEGRKKLLSPRLKAIKKLDENHELTTKIESLKLSAGYEYYRLGFRSITGATNERALVVSIIPANVFTGNSLTVSIPIYDVIHNGQHIETPYYRKLEILFCAAIMASYICDWFIRLKILTNMNMFYVYQIPIPRTTIHDLATFNPIIKRAARLVCTTPEFDDLAKEAGLEGYQEGVTDPAKRAQLKAELDGLVAHLYGLTEEEFVYVLSTFPLVEPNVKQAALEAYRAMAPKTADEEVKALITSGESISLEFKSSARWDMRENKQNKLMEQIVVKTVAAMLNTDGGTLLVGVDDDGNTVGLKHDYQTLKKKDRDGYENWLITLLLDAYGKETSPLIRITFHQVDQQEICRITISPSPKPVYIKEGNAEHLFIRAGNSSRQLTTREAVEYCKQHWNGGKHPAKVS